MSELTTNCGKLPLKTLKDLFEKERNGKLQKYHSVDINLILKAEAIKWVKKWNVSEMERDIKFLNKEVNLEMAMLIGGHGAFIEFFNLTEADLGEEK